MSAPPQVLLPPAFSELHPRQCSATEDSFIGPNLPSQLSRVTQSITDESLRKVVEKILGDLIFLIDYLSLIRDNPEQSPRFEMVTILQAVRNKATSLLNFIETEALHGKELDNTTRQTFDCLVYAIRHDLKRTFESELGGLTEARADRQTYEALFDAQGLLRNCFQHCIINLIQVFDHNITAEQLFDDWGIRRQQSLHLCEELSALIRILNSESAHSPKYIAKRLKMFRQGSMQWLMYKDWQEYETLSGRVIDALDLGNTPSDLLHQLSCYMETLLTQVKARAVLANSDPLGGSAQQHEVFI